MCRRSVVLAVCALGLACQAAWAAQPGPLPPSEVPKRTDPFARVPSGKVALRRTDGGFLVICNVPGNRFTLKLAGKKVEQIERQTGRATAKLTPIPDKGMLVDGKDYRQFWSVDGVPLEIITIPLGPGAAPYPVDAEQVLSADQQFEDDYQAKVGQTEIRAARKWLEYASGEPMLYWELKLPEKAGDPTAAGKRLYANTLNGRTVIRMAATWLRDDEAKVRRLLVETMRSLVRHEKTAVLSRRDVDENIRGGGKVLLLNEELATRQDRKIPNAIPLPPEKLMFVLRSAFELDPNAYTWQVLVFDGYKAHVISLSKYDRKSRQFVYQDTTGKKSFLEEENNRAGVKARLAPHGWEVSEGDLQKVLHGVFIEYHFVRFYLASGGWVRAVQEYGRLRQLVPGSAELREARLLKAAGLLAEGKEYGPSSNLYAACEALHPKSARATAGLAGVFAKVGRPDRAAAFYAEALKKLPEDQGLTEAQRRQLAGEWEPARRALAAERAPPAPKR